MSDSLLPRESPPPPRVSAGKGAETAQQGTRVGGNDALVTICDICGSTDVVEIRCKLICRNCRTILQTCSDL